MDRLFKILLLFISLTGTILLQAVAAQEETPDQKPEKEDSDYAMDNDRLERIIKRIDPDYDGESGLWQLRVADITLRVITDEKNDRMRIIIPIRKAKELSTEEMYRILQANYDTTLDARYAIAQDILWSTFIHPLSSLTDEDFISGLGQAINIVTTYGDTYTSGALTFGGGDSGELIEKQLIEELMKRGEII